MFKSIEKEAEAEIVEKKSRFIAQIFAVNSKEEAEQVLANVKKKYYDAKHNCYAYIVDNIEKCSDDGEPSGTAGAPMLDLLKNNGLNNIIVVVTRYFGGTLLGTGGLVRAYTEAAVKAIELANIVQEEEGFEIEVVVDYQNLEKLKYYCNKNNIKIVKIDYKDVIICNLEVTKQEKENLTKEYNETINILEYKVIREKPIRKFEKNQKN